MPKLIGRIRPAGASADLSRRSFLYRWLRLHGPHIVA